MLLYQSLLSGLEHAWHAAGLPVKRLDSGTSTQQTFTATSLQDETARPERKPFSTSSC